MRQRSERHEFASDNTAGICPEAFEALGNANINAAPSYGEDRWTARVCDRIRELFEIDCDVYLVFNGTAANALALAQLCQSFQSVVCHAYSHIQTDECGAPEFFTKGSKLLLIGGANGKIDIGEAEAVIAGVEGSIHRRIDTLHRVAVNQRVLAAHGRVRQESGEFPLKGLQFLLERQQSLLYQGVADGLAKSVLDVLTEDQRQFSDKVSEEIEINLAIAGASPK